MQGDNLIEIISIVTGIPQSEVLERIRNLSRSEALLIIKLAYIKDIKEIT